MPEARPITVAGAGILGLWQALMLARDGHRVRLVEASETPFAQAASRYAGAMIAPETEAEGAPAEVRDWGRDALALWRTVLPDLRMEGSLVVAATRDRSELTRFAQLTERHRWLDEAALAALEPALAGRFAGALHYPDEAHLATPAVLDALLAAVRAAGADVRFGHAWRDGDAGGDLVVDCRGIGARRDLPRLRGVRGERIVLASRDVVISRPVRLLHPRIPFYLVPWGDGRYMAGATVLESEHDGPMTARAALELLGMAYALHPGLGEAQIVDLGAGVRPAFADNVPRVVADGAVYRVNGAYRHGFLLAPILAEALAAELAGRLVREGVIVRA